MIRGGCLCGGVRFAVERAAGPFELCHCRRCRKATGAAFAAMVGVSAADFRWETGRDLVVRWEAPVVDAPPGYRTAFCRRCGAPVPDPPPGASWFEIAAGLFDDDPGLRPERHVFVEGRAPWFAIGDGLPQFDAGSIARLRSEGRDGRPGRAPAVAGPAAVIRLARPEDVAGIERLIDASVRGLSAGDYDARQIESALRHMFGVDTQLVADGTYFVATEGDRFVGCGGWSRRRTLFGADRFKSPGVDDRLDPAREPARIRAFFVHPDRARRGIGRRIIALCEEAARRAGFTRAELMATRPGEPLYAAMGYAVLERVDVALPDGLVLPCARMARDLGP